MSTETKKIPSQRDANSAENERPIPSQAEGDRETIEEDLEQKEKASSATASDKK